MPDQATIIHSLAELLDVRTRAEASHVPLSPSVNELINALAKIASTQADAALKTVLPQDTGR